MQHGRLRLLVSRQLRSSKQFRHAEYPVQRSAQFMGQGSHEFRLLAVGLARGVAGVFRFLARLAGLQ